MRRPTCPIKFTNRQLVECFNTTWDLYQQSGDWGIVPRIEALCAEIQRRTHACQMSEDDWIA
jgi:hypothetical protein